MFTKLFAHDMEHAPAPREGDLYRELTIRGKSFKLVYGYYEDFERESPFNEPMPLYPDFIKEPVYTDDGIPFVTAMQDVCKRYTGETGGDSCSKCVHFQKSIELFGFCYCQENKQTPPETEVVKNE